MKKAYVLEGNLSQRREVKNRLKESMADYEMFVFSKEDKLDSVIKMITEISCFGCLRLFVVSEIPIGDEGNASSARTKALNAFQKIIPEIPDGNVVLFDNLDISSKKFLEIVEKHGKIFKFDQKISEAQTKNKLLHYCEKNNKTISEESITAFIHGLLSSDNKVDIDEMDILLLKLEHYVGSRKNITHEDIYNICSHSKEFVIWYLYDLFDKKDFCGSILVANDMISKFKDPQIELSSFLSQLIWRYKLLYMARSGSDKNINIEDIKNEISKIIKLEREGQAQKMKMTPLMEKEETIPQYSSGMLYSIFNSRGNKHSPANCYSLKQLELINYAIYKALLKVRVGCTRSEASIILEFVLMTICDQIKKYQTLNILENKKLLIYETMDDD